MGASEKNVYIYIITVKRNTTNKMGVSALSISGAQYITSTSL